MSDLDFIVAPAEQVFRSRKSGGNNPGLWLAGGIGLLGLAVFGFVVALVSRVDPIALQAMTTLPAMGGIGCIVVSKTMKATPDEVGVGPGGLRVVGRDGATTHGWETVGWCKVDAAPMSNRKVLTVFDTTGKPLLRLGDSLDGFHEMVELVQANIAAKPDSTASTIQTIKARKQAVTMGLGGILSLSIAISFAFMTRQAIRADKLMKTSAVPGNGVIVRRFLAPNGVTPRLEYRVTDASGESGVRNAELERGYWDSLAGARSVPVKYVPGDPGISRLLVGEVEKKEPYDNPLVGYGLSGIVAVMSIFLITCGVLSWRGWDIDLDSRTGKLSIKRFGEGR